MAKDAELDRLKTAQEAAFQRKQDAYQAQQRAWERRSSARDVMNRAFETKQRAYAEQDRTWQYYQSVRNANGSRIDSLNSQQETAYQNMSRSYDAASSAYERRDGASASSYAAEGRSYKEESQRCVAERRGLVEEIRSARAQHEASKPAFQRAKDDFNAAKRTFDSAKTEHERAQAEFQQRKAEAEAAKKAFHERREWLQKEKNLRQEKDRHLASKIGVPSQYLDSFKVRYNLDGGVDIFFGGVGTPDGPGHGHYASDRFGKVTYRRDPFDPHGSQNFTDDPRWQRFDGGFGDSLTYRGRNAIKESGVDTVTGRPTINFYYGGEGGNPFGEGHGHDVAYQSDPGVIVFTRPPRR